MASSLDLSLPAAPPSRGRGGFVQWLTLLGVLAIIGILVWRSLGPTATLPGGTEANADSFKELATKLEKRTLYGEAEKAWAGYMAAAELSTDERADTLYRRAKCLKEEGLYAQAAGRLSELDSLDVSQERKRAARRMLLECLSALGKNTVRDDLSRSFAVRDEERGTVIARVGGDEITREELREELSTMAEQVFRQQGVPLTPTERESRALAFVEQQMDTPEAARQALMGLITSRLLYREGLERGLADESALPKVMERFRRQHIATSVVEAEQERALSSLGPTEISNHFEAHKERFIEPARTEFSYAAFPTLDAAAQALATMASGGQVGLERVAGAALRGQPLPAIGLAPELTAHILALDEGEVSDRPLVHAGRSFIFRAEKRHAQRQLALDEAEPQVRADLARRKSAEAIEALQTLLGQKFRVEILDANLLPKDDAGNPPGSGADADGADADDAANGGATQEEERTDNASSASTQ